MTRLRGRRHRLPRTNHPSSPKKPEPPRAALARVLRGAIPAAPSNGTSQMHPLGSGLQNGKFGRRACRPDGPSIAFADPRPGRPPVFHAPAAASPPAGLDPALIDPAWLRRQVGVVPRESVLFNRSVRDNIALADRTVSMDRIVKAATMAGAHEFILQMPEGYDTQIEERGMNLSGGQRQRIAIARALLMDPRILIFDEATSALDAETEAVVQDNMAEIVKGRTVIIVAHRKSALKNCSITIDISHGQAHVRRRGL
ncbi:MAG: ATP-binding cassette domain-containing protein [Rhodospirillales bacterium]|nr:MAG: ATP-binding cassette domain-containing protein [Rhodospirillales bacterium]